ncbi:MAG TPA: TlpA disulfide reductase family protein [Cyclobacteriaceae bacterium]|jgi:thiol-disulfide isomerase/thioredoxin|nr:TlpA disulfide reductase family protein [Cyclobacteriaceae bacterium]
MTKAIFTFPFVLLPFFSLAQQASKIFYQDSVGKAMSFEAFRKATESGTLFSKQMSVEGDTVTQIYHLESKAERKKLSDERIISEKNLLGKALPDSKLKRLDGSDFNLSMLKGRTLVINFWFIQCSPCIAEIPELNRVVNHYQNKPDILFFAPALDDVDDLKKFLGKHRFSYVVLGQSEELSKKIGISSFPTNIIINSDGLIDGVIVGGKEKISQVLTEAIDRTLAKASPR